MNIKQQALEAARPHAKNIDDLLANAAKIEAYLLGTTSLTPVYDDKDVRTAIIGDIVNEKTHTPVEVSAELPIRNPFDPDSLPVALDDDAAELVALAKGLTSDLSSIGYTEPTGTARRQHAARYLDERAKLRLKEMANTVAKCDITDAPLPERPNLRAEFSMENYTVEIRDNKQVPQRVKLRPMQLQLGQYMAEEDVVVNVCRQFGTTTMIAAFARQQRIWGQKVLIITNTRRDVETLNDLINDVSVSVYSFADIDNRVWAGESYNHIVIDNAAFIPYASEHRIADYVSKCRTESTRLTSISVPGQEAGWFFDQWSDGEHDSVRKIAVDWKLSAMTPAAAAKLRKEVGEMIFRNQFENQFRPVAVPSGNTDLTR